MKESYLSTTRSTIEVREDSAFAYIHASSKGLLLYGTPSQALVRSLLGTHLKSFVFSNEFESEGFFTVIPRIYDPNSNEDSKIPRLYKKLTTRSIDNLIRKKRFEKTLHNEGVCYRNVAMTIFQVRDEETFRNYFMHVPEIVNHIDHPLSKEEYCNRLQQWIDLGWHPNIVRAYTIRELVEEEQLVLLTDTFHTTTLRDWINAGKGFLYEDFPNSSTRKVLNVLLQISSGLTHIHDKQTVHHDLKPENIYIHEGETVKIGGLFLFSPRRYQIAKQKSPFVGGSPEYWSSEQGSIYDTMKDSVRDPRMYSGFINTLPHVNEKIDIYALGLIIMEILDGRRSWIRGDKIDFLIDGWIEEVQQVSENDRRFLSQSTRTLRAIALQCLSQKPDERPSAPEITHKILDLHTRLFESPAERLWQRYVMDQTLSVKRFNSIIQYEPIESDCDSFNNIAVSYFKRDKYEESIKLWDKAIAMDPFHSSSIYNLGLTRSLRNESNFQIVLRQLYNCPESPERNYFISLLYMNEGKFRCITNPIIRNANLLQEDAMKRKLEDIGTRFYTMVAIDLNERYKFMQLTPVKPICFAGQTKFFVYIAMQSMPVLYAWNLDDFESSKLAMLNIELPDRRAVHPYNLIISSSQRLFAFCMEINIYIYSYEPSANSISFQGTLKGHQSRILSMSFDSSGKRMASGGADNVVRVWDCLEGTCFRLFRNHSAVVNSVVFTPDDELIASASEDCRIIIWRIYTGEELHVLNSASGPVKNMAVDLELGILICSCSNQTMLHFWDLTLNRVVIRLDGHWQLSRGIEISHKRKLALSYSGDGTVRLWSLKSGNCLVTFGPYSAILSAKFSELSDEIIFTDEDLRVRSISYVTNAELNGNELGICIKPNELITNVDHYFANEFIYKESLKELVETFRTLTLQTNPALIDNLFSVAEKIKKSVNLYRKEEIRKILYEINILKLNYNGLSVVNFSMEAYTFPKPHHERSNISCFALNKSRTMVGIGETDGKIRIYKIATHQLLKALKTNRSGRVLSIAFSEDSTMLVESNCGENIVRLWSIESGNMLQEHNIHSSWATNVGMINNSRIMLSCGQDSQIICFDTKLREVNKRRMNINKGESYTAIITSEDTKTLFTGSSDHIIRIWDITTKCRVKAFHGHSDIIVDLAIDKETNTLISVSLDGTMRFWSLVNYRCDRVTQLPHPHIRYFDFLQIEKLTILTFHNSIIVLFDIKQNEVKWTLKPLEEVIAAVWYRYPTKILLVTTIYVKIIDVFWKYN